MSEILPIRPVATDNVIHASFALSPTQPVEQIELAALEMQKDTAVVYCEGNFAAIDGKTANGLVRHSEKYVILAVIDSQLSGRNSGEVLDAKPNGIPILADLEEAYAGTRKDARPKWFIYGMAPASGKLTSSERQIVLDALSLGMGVISGLHEFLSEDDEFVQAAKAANAELIDIRKPRAKADLRMFTGDIARVTCPRVAVLGTDCAIGKRTTASVLTSALNTRGIHAVLVTTGQTGMMQGSKFGVALDAVPSQFCAGELEATIIEAFDQAKPDIILVEGQGALSHPAFSTSAFILRGSVPDGVILQHAPKRKHRCDFPTMPMPMPETEIALIETFCDTEVIGLTLNHEDMSDSEIEAAIELYNKELGLPVTDALARPEQLLVDMVLASFPELEGKLTATVT